MVILNEVSKRRKIKDPVQEKLDKAIETLEKLAKLGNGGHYGNSVGNQLAIDCLNKIN